MKKIFLFAIVFSLFLIPFVSSASTSKTATTYFSDYVPFVAWETNPGNMTDGYPESYASTITNLRQEIVKSPFFYEGTDEIEKVEINVCGYATAGTTLFLEPSIGGSYSWSMPTAPACRNWEDITGSEDWDRNSIKALWIRIYPQHAFGFTAYVGIVGLRITYQEREEYLQNTTTGAGLFIERNISYGDLLSVFF